MPRKIVYGKLRPFESAYNTLKKRCAERQRIFSLTYEEFLEFTKTENCHYCGDNVNWTPHGSAKKGDNSHACHLDRVDSKLGYAKNNCVVCCWPCNIMKQSLPLEEFLGRIKRIYERHF